MPELPEVETVRRQLVPLVENAFIDSVEVEDARALKRHQAPLEEKVSNFVSRLTGQQLAKPVRRGKFMWIPITQNDGTPPKEAILAHLGMSGQMLARAENAADDKHVRARIWLRGPSEKLLRLDFADQRRFGSLAIDTLIPTEDGHAGGSGSTQTMIPTQAAHISRDPLDEAFDTASFISKTKTKKVGIKKILLDQTMISGVGNIYADEALWYTKVHPETPGQRISKAKLNEIVDTMREVFERALEWGGTSFDEQYVNVNGEAGYFAQSLEAYGRHGLQCTRCGTTIQKQPFMGRNSHFCPECQRKGG